MSTPNGKAWWPEEAVTRTWGCNRVYVHADVWIRTQEYLDACERLVARLERFNRFPYPDTARAVYVALRGAQAARGMVERARP